MTVYKRSIEMKSGSTLIKTHPPLAFETYQDKFSYPCINWQNAPACKLVKLLFKLLHLCVPLPDAFNVKKTQCIS